MNTYISDKGIKILKELKNKTVIRIIADDWRDYNRSYGNIKIDFEDCSVEIENDYRNVSYFGVNEELAGYDVICLKNGNFESSVMSDNLYVKNFNKKITGISIIRDTVMIDYSNNIKREKYLIDQAVIFKFDDMKWLISQTSIFTPMSKMLFSKNINEGIKSIEKIKSDWEDNADTGKCTPAYNVDIKREILEI